MNALTYTCPLPFPFKLFCGLQFPLMSNVFVADNVHFESGKLKLVETKT